EGFQSRCAVARKGRSVFSSDGQHQLSADDCSIDHAAAGDDRALPARLVPDAADRPAAVSGLDLLHFELLPGSAEGTAAENMVAHFFVHAVCYGYGLWHLRAQRASGDRSARWQATRVCAHTEIQH